MPCPASMDGIGTLFSVGVAIWQAVEHHGMRGAGVVLERDSMVGDVSLLLWILWLGGCCQVPASQAAMVVVPCVLEAVWGQAALSRLQG